MKKTFLIIAIGLMAMSVQAQQGDTIIVELAKTSRVVFTIKDRSDLEILKHYDFNELFKDMLIKLEANDTTALVKKDSSNVTVTVDTNEDWHHKDYNDDGEHEDDEDNDWNNHNPSRRTWQSFNFDLGTNNYLANGKFPDSENALHSVRPWGSWYVAGSSIQRTRLAKKFFLEWGLGINWYNFKFQDDNVLIQKDNTSIEFVEDTRNVDFTKSKLTVSYINASLIPVIDFGDHNKKSRVWDGYGNSFRIGLGPYIGYRVSSHTKLVYEENGDKKKDKNFDSFYINTVRYGARLQLGYRSTDLFFNYDLNELFATDKGPKLNAFSFGVIF